MISGGVNAESVYELTPVIVTATKTAESAEKVPASVSVVTAKEIAAHNLFMSAYYMIKVIIGRVVVLPKRQNNNLLFSGLLVHASGRVLY